MDTSTATAALPLPASAGCMCAEQLARFLGVNRKTVYEYAARNVIPHQRLGRRIVFSREQVVAWLGACRASPTGKAI
jgi:excisionase family DNA binding protein